MKFTLIQDLWLHFVHLRVFLGLKLGSSKNTFWPSHEKICLQGFLLRKTQTSLLNYRDWLETWNFAWNKCRNTFQQAASKVCWSGFVVKKTDMRLCCSHAPKSDFSRVMSILSIMHPVLQCVNFSNAQGMKAIKSNTRPPVGTRSKPGWFMRW